MTISRVQGANNAVNGGIGTSSLAATFSSTVTSGNAVVGSFIWEYATGHGTDTITISDDQSNTYTVVEYATNTDIGGRMASFYLTNITNAPITITVSFASLTSNGSPTMVMDEFSGIATSSALDTHSANAQISAPSTTDGITSGSATTATNGDLIYGAGTNYFSDPIAIGTGFTAAAANIGSGHDTRAEYLIQSSAGSIAATFTDTFSGDDVTAIMLALKPAPPAVVFVPPRPRIRPVVRTYYVR